MALKSWYINLIVIYKKRNERPKIGQEGGDQPNQGIDVQTVDHQPQRNNGEGENEKEQNWS